jgi:hypothetical protein
MGHDKYIARKGPVGRSKLEWESNVVMIFKKEHFGARTGFNRSTTEQRTSGNNVYDVYSEGDCFGYSRDICYPA